MNFMQADLFNEIASALFIIIIGFISWQGKRQIGRIDKLEARLLCIEENTNNTVNDIKSNYVNQFRDVRQDIADLREANAEHFGDIKCIIAKIETTVKMEHKQ